MKFQQKKERARSFNTTCLPLIFTVDTLTNEVVLDTLHFILIAYGMTFIIGYGKIFEDIRPKKDYTKKWNTLWNCPLCTGFWVGIFLSLLSPYTTLFSYERSFVNAFLLGCLSAGTSYLISVLVDDFGFRLSSRSGGEHVDD